MPNAVSDWIAARRREAVEILTDPDYAGRPSLREAAWRFLHQHGVTDRGLPARAEG